MYAHQPVIIACHAHDKGRDLNPWITSLLSKEIVLCIISMWSYCISQRPDFFQGRDCLIVEHLLKEIGKHIIPTNIVKA
jgi:hypothetical protein